MSTYINNKLFAYVSTYDIAKRKAEDIYSYYPNSLVFIGNEGIIWQPLTNTYIGLGASAYSYLNTWIDKTYKYADDAYNRVTIDTINGVGPDATKNITFTTSHDDLATFKEDTSNSNTIQLDLGGLNSKLNTQGLNSKAFAVENTTKQINTLYQLLLGSDKDPNQIYVEHELNHFFDPATDEVFNKPALWIDVFGNKLYTQVKLAYIGAYTGYINNDVNNSYSYNQYQIQDALNSYTVYETFTADSTGNIITIQSGISENHDHGTETIGSGISYIIYSQPTGKINSYAPNISITDSIDTIREIAYILDIITDDKNDNGISLAYSIVETYTGLQDEISYRKGEDANIRKEMVKGVSISGNDYLNVVELNSYTYNGLKTGAITSQLSINVAEVGINKTDNSKNHEVGYFDDSNKWHWIYEYPNSYNYTKTYQILPTDIDSETLENYSYNGVPEDLSNYIKFHAENTNTQTPVIENHHYYTIQDGKYKKYTGQYCPSQAYFEIIPYKDKYEYTNGNLDNANKLLTTVEWVSSYVAILNSYVNNLKISDKISSYLINNLPKHTSYIHLNKDTQTNTYKAGIITDLTPVIDETGIKINATYTPFENDILEININHNVGSDPFYKSANSDLELGEENENVYIRTRHTLNLTYTLLIDTLDNSYNISQTSLNSYDGFASANNVSQTFTNMFTWYKISENNGTIEDHIYVANAG